MSLYTSGEIWKIIIDYNKKCSAEFNWNHEDEENYDVQNDEYTVYKKIIWSLKLNKYTIDCIVGYISFYDHENWEHDDGMKIRFVVHNNNNVEIELANYNVSVKDFIFCVVNGFHCNEKKIPVIENEEITDNLIDRLISSNKGLLRTYVDKHICTLDLHGIYGEMLDDMSEEYRYLLVKDASKR